MMPMHSVAKYILLFLIYSLIGVIAEAVFGLIVDHRLNRIYGFLYLPILPIYGFGAAFVLFMHRYLRNPALLFVASVLITTLLEFIAHWLIQVLFGIQVWDYSDKPFNFQGRVSLDGSIAFGVAAILLVYVIHPWVSRVLRQIPKRLTIILAAIAGSVLFIDIVASIMRRLV
jgi:uncharacterized membrane protein